MKRNLILLLSITALLLCHQHNYAKNAGKDNIAYSSAHNELQEWKAFMNEIHEPDLDSINQEAYRFYYHDMYVFTLLINDDSTAILNSKMVMRKGTPVITGNDTSTAIESEIFKSTSQQLTKEQYLQFKKLVYGYYSWPVEDSCFPIDTQKGIAYNFEAKAQQYTDTKLTYFWEQFVCLYRGNFRAIYHFLVKNSNLLNEAEKKELVDLYTK